MKTYILMKYYISVNGVWGNWLSNSACSVSCGNGTEPFIRFCNNPAPVCGGQQCVGPESKTDACNIRDCPTCTYNGSTYNVGDSMPGYPGDDACNNW